MLQELINGHWIEQRRGAELANLAMHFAFRKIQCQPSHDVAATLPKLRPSRQAQVDAMIAKPVEQEPDLPHGRIKLPARVVMAGNWPEPRGGSAAFNWTND